MSYLGLPCFHFCSNKRQEYVCVFSCYSNTTSELKDENCLMSLTPIE